MDYVPSPDFIASIFTSDLLDQDGFGFEFPDPTTVPSAFISFQNGEICDLVIENGSKEDRKRKGCCEVLETGEMEKNKRMRHRDVERQRRQEVSSLFKKLRSLLPLPYVKGKRSSSDHVLESVNYIKDLQKKIKELNEKKDRIKKLSDRENTALGSQPFLTEECTSSSSLSSSSSSSSLSSSSSTSCSCAEEKHISVVVMPCMGGSEIVLSCCFRHKLCLSTVLQVLAQEEGFNVVRCTSTTLQSRLIHSIFGQADQGRNINFMELQDKIMKIRR